MHVGHPVLSELGIFAAYLESVGGLINDGQGRYKVTITMVEYAAMSRRPRGPIQGGFGHGEVSTAEGRRLIAEQQQRAAAAPSANGATRPRM